MKNKWIHLLMISLSGLLTTRCEDSGGGSRNGAINNTVTQSPDGSSPGDITITFGTLSASSLLTSDSGEQNCLDFSVSLTDASGTATAEIEVAFAVVAQTSASDTGTVTPGSAATDASGKISGKYCSGREELTGTILATAQGVSANSGTFTVKRSGAFNLSFSDSSVPAVVEGEGSDPVITLNLIDSGPNECTNLTFLVTENDAPVVGTEVTFLSQPDFPKGVKLAKKDDTGTTVTDENSGKQMASFTGTSSSEGILTVPVCAGVSLGTLIVTGQVQDEDGKVKTAQSPVISIKAGLPSYTNFSLTFDPVNGRTLKGYFNTNSSHVITTQVKVGSRGDGDPILDHPVTVASETGKIEVLNGGLIDPATGSAKFKISALHMGNNYAYPTDPFTGYPDARTRCDPIDVSSSLGGVPATYYDYKDLAKNWRSTVVYMVRGQEYFHDANRNGIYDGGGDGFWDRNQNGVFDGSDVLTYDANNNSTFDYSGEWFIDLPSPFIDVDENLAYDSGYDIIIGDRYTAANGVRDTDTIIWKYEYYPIFMGVSPYGMQRYRVHSTYTSLDLDITALTTGTAYEDSVLFTGTTLGNDDFWGAGANDATRAQARTISQHTFAHGICGNPIPGGSKIVVDTRQVSGGEYGARTVTNHFYIQPGDQILEPSRRLLKESTGANQATFNFNAVDHPFADYSYPVFFNTYVKNCDASCTGAVTVAGVACDSMTMELILSFQEPEFAGSESNSLSRFISIGSVKTCTCATGAYFEKGSCTCPEGTAFDGATCAVVTP